MTSRADHLADFAEFLTASPSSFHAAAETARRLAAAGFDAHLVKPVTLERLLQVLERASRREPRNAPTHATKVRPRRRIPDGA